MVARDALLPPAAGVLATACASSALTAVIDGAAWFGYVLITAMLIAATGVALRALRVPAALVGISQLATLLLLVTGAFTTHGILAIIPGPAAFGQLDTVLTASFEQIKTGLPPVPATQGILCLVTIALGLVAVLVDTLVVTAAAPAVTGLILLCVYAVPASLSDGLLPWWTFVVGAAAFAGLLAVDGDHRHRRWRTREVPTNSARSGAVATPVTMLSMAVVIGLIAGSSITAVGTVGRLPGAGSGDARTVAGGLGIHPFTALRGMLNRNEEVPLFRVRGLGDDQRLLRAFTLPTYRPNQGWTLPPGPMPRGVPAQGALPVPPGTDVGGEVREIRIEPLNWTDVWLPVYGTPLGLRGLDKGWYYEPGSGAVFRESSKSAGPYTEFANISQPTREQLRAADSQAGDVPSAYTELSYVDPRVAALAEEITSGETTRYGKARALWEYFGPQNGFTYDTRTAPASDANALADFLLNGKRGYCEQYASAMAVMLRALDIPSRVAVGFTAGYRDGKQRVITSRDAHAWVEVYFSGIGWVSFDPTPLADGRGFVPSYLESGDTAAGTPGGSDSQPSAGPDQPSPGLDNKLSKLQPGAVAPQPPPSTFPARAPAWAGWVTVVLAILAIALTITTVLVFRRADRVATQQTPQGRELATARTARWLPPASGASWVVVLLLAGWQLHWVFAVVLALVGAAGIAPSVTREVIRRRRLHTIAGGRPTAARAAWQELLDECADREQSIAPGDTLRETARKVAEDNRLDPEGTDALRSVVNTMERQWYGPAEADEPVLSGTFTRVRRSLADSAPMPLRARLLPRSVFNRRRTSGES